MAKKYIDAELLNKDIEKYFQGLWPGMETADQCNTDMHFTPTAIMRLANHFYELGKKDMKEQMIRECSVQASYEAEIEKAEERGYNLCKEQMLNDAVDGAIGYIEECDAHYLSIYDQDELENIILSHFEEGDKVKIVIIPEKED